MTISTALLWVLSAGCDASNKPASEAVLESDTGRMLNDSALDTGESDMSSLDEIDNGHFTPDFQTWLTQHPEYTSDLIRTDLDGGSFGGRINTSDAIHHRPVIFIHGNSDRALGGPLDGWRNARDFFLAQGYTSAELYASTYGPADISYISEYRHDTETLHHIRQLLDAVLAYTGSSEIDVIAFSLGVTLARKAILGGGFTDADGASIQLGPPLSNHIQHFVAIAGANQGLSTCYGATTNTCSPIDGLYPGTLVGLSVINQAQILQNINQTQGYEGARRTSVWSRTDDVLGFGGLVWGKNTAQLPAQTDEIIIDNATHLALKTQVISEIYDLLQTPP